LPGRRAQPRTSTLQSRVYKPQQTTSRRPPSSSPRIQAHHSSSTPLNSQLLKPPSLHSSLTPHPRYTHTTPTTHDPKHQRAPTMSHSSFPSPSSPQYLGIGVHQGAVDPSTVTSAPPPEVMRHILGVLQGMGVAITEESKFRLRCVRPLRRDSDASDRTTSSEESTNSVSFLSLDLITIWCPRGARTLFPGKLAFGHITVSTAPLPSSISFHSMPWNPPSPVGLPRVPPRGPLC